MFLYKNGFYKKSNFYLRKYLPIVSSKYIYTKVHYQYININK